MLSEEKIAYIIIDVVLLFTHHYLETYKPKSHCRRQSGMNFGYVAVNGVNSNDVVLAGGQALGTGLTE